LFFKCRTRVGQSFHLLQVSMMKINWTMRS
jgi:hypothetical protein